MTDYKKTAAAVSAIAEHYWSEIRRRRGETTCPCGLCRLHVQLLQVT